MHKALIICAGGMSSSMIAMKTKHLLRDKGYEVNMEACGTRKGKDEIEKNSYELFLISPQTKMYYKILKESAIKSGAHICQIPPQAYITVDSGINEMAKLVIKELKL